MDGYRHQKGRALVLAFVLVFTANAGSAQSLALRGSSDNLVEMSEQGLDAEELFDRVTPSIWIVGTAGRDGKPLASGSAVVIAREVLVTNCHVLRDAGSVIIRRGSVVFPATESETDRVNDLCLLRVPGLDAPPVLLAPEASLRPGMRVYAVGAPRRLEQTISDGLLSGLRRDASGKLAMVQTSAPISPGSSGGGLFDAHGRLVGITTSGLKDSQNLNFAVPSQLVLALGRRAGVEATVGPMRPASSVAGPSRPPTVPDTGGGKPVASAPPLSPALPSAPRPPESPADLTAKPSKAPAPAPSVSPVAAPPVRPVPTAPVANVNDPRRIDYQLRDRLTGLVRIASFIADPTETATRSFNGGRWVERSDGSLLEANSQAAGDFDAAVPPEGWVPANQPLSPGATWRSKYNRKQGEQFLSMDITATVAGTESRVVADRTMPVIAIEYRGYTTRIGNSVASSQNQTGKYEATAWYSPDLRRVVRFAAKTRGGIGGGTFVVDEELNLVAIR